ncbi:MAG: peptide deformylase, partial [Pseudomonadota bacterium]
MRHPILIHPDPRLRTVCEPITDFGEEIAKLKDQMLGTMYEAPGLGLAAPQVGITKRLLVMDCAKT